MVGTARINKRNADVTDKIIQMYNTGRLKFSFEIWASEIHEEDGVTVVDANPGNQLTAMAIVTTPALPAAVAIGLAADVDIEAFRCKVWHLLDQKFGMDRWQIVWMGLEYAVLYFYDKGNMLRVEYKMDGDELVSTDVYEVTFSKVEEVNEDMDKLNAEATNVATPAIEETTATADAVLNMNTVRPEEGEGNTSAECGLNPEDAACDNREAAACGDDQRAEIENDIDDDLKDESNDDAEDLEEMRRELETVKAELAAYKKAEEDAKLAEKKENARRYAEREGLDLNAEAVKAAIENADYEALAAEVMAKPIAKGNDETTRIVAEMKIDSPFGNMFEKCN